MSEYSKNNLGIGIFINLQADAAGKGDLIGQNLQNAFASRGVPTEYHVNQSRGTSTDITFYVRGVDYSLNVESL